VQFKVVKLEISDRAMEVSTLEALSARCIIKNDIQCQEFDVPLSVMDNLYTLSNIQILRKEKSSLKCRIRRLEKLLPQAIAKFNQYQTNYEKISLDDIELANAVGAQFIQSETSVKEIEKEIFECIARLEKTNLKEEKYISNLVWKYKISM